MTIRTVHFDAAVFRDTVTLAVRPLDRWTRRPVTSGIAAVLWDPVADRPLPGRFVENLSGHLVLINLPRDVDYTISLQVGDAGYLDPGLQLFHPTDDARELVVLLDRAATNGYDDGVTVLRGQVVPHDGAGAEVTADPDGAMNGVINITVPTDGNGGFALPVRFGRGPTGDDVVIRVRSSADVSVERRFSYPLGPGRTYALADPIDLTGTDIPVLVPTG